MNQQATRVAVIQAAPVYLDPDGCLEKARRLVGQAASKGAALVAFGEAWLPGYPIHALAGVDAPGWWDLAAEYLDRAIDIPGRIASELCSIASEHQVDIVMGVAERDPVTRGSIYATQLLVGPEGRIVSRHRKLRPALNERSVFADGDSSGLRAVDRGYGIVSALSGWEHQMALPAYALAEQGTQFHVASWPGGETPAPSPPAALFSRQHLLSRAFAAQTGSYVLSASGILSADHVPPQFRDFLKTPFTGNSIIVDPRGEICAGPVTGETILYANCSPTLLRTAKVAFDCAGHSGRPDQLEFRNHNLHQDGEDMPPGGDPGEDQNQFQGQHGFGNAPPGAPNFEAGGVGEQHKPGGPGWQVAAGPRGSSNVG